MPAYFFSDVFGTLAAVALFPLLLVAPGYAAGDLLNLFGFRGFTAAWRLAASAVLSVSISPLIVYLGLRCGSAAFVWAAFAPLWIAAGARLRRAGGGIPRTMYWFGAGWLLIVVLSLADLQFGDRLYYSAVAWDHSAHVAVIDAITRTGMPAETPFNRLSGPTPLKYHAFWFALCSFAQRFGTGWLNARHALNASVFWAGLSLMSLVCLWLRIFERLSAKVLRTRALIGLGLLTVTGLDLFPVAFQYLRRNALRGGDMEWWARDQVTSWVDVLLWSPHHVAGLVAGFTGFLLLWFAATQCQTPRTRWVHAVMAGAAFACATGCSVYVGLAFAATMSVCLAIRAMRPWIVIAGVSALLFGLPYIVQLAQAGGAAGVLHVGIWDGSWFANPLLALFALPAEYFVEFGFFALAAVWKVRHRSREDAPALAIGLTAFVLCTFVRSMPNNDLGWRGMMLVQFLLVVWGAKMLDAGASPPWRTGIVRALLVLGLAGTIYQLAMLRSTYVMADAGMFPPTDYASNIGARAWSLRTLYGALDRLTPVNAVVQTNPADRIDWGLYSHRASLITGIDFGCLAEFGGDPAECAFALPQIDRLFRDPDFDVPDAEEMTRRFRIDAVVVTDSDPVWRDPKSWIYFKKALVETPNAKAFLFGKMQDAASQKMSR